MYSIAVTLESLSTFLQVLYFLKNNILVLSFDNCIMW